MASWDPARGKLVYPGEVSKGVLVPYRDGGSLSELHDLAGEMEREDTAEGVRVKARVPAGSGKAAAPGYVGAAFHT